MGVPYAYDFFLHILQLRFDLRFDHFGAVCGSVSRAVGIIAARGALTQMFLPNFSITFGVLRRRSCDTRDFLGRQIPINLENPGVASRMDSLELES